MENLGLDGAGWWRLGARRRKGVLVVHIVSAGAWIGIDVVIAVLVFTSPPFALRDQGIRSFAICGNATEVGIEPTVRQGADLGYVPVVIEDACGAGDEAAGACNYR